MQDNIPTMYTNPFVTIYLFSKVLLSDMKILFKNYGKQILGFFIILKIYGFLHLIAHEIL